MDVGLASPSTVWFYFSSSFVSWGQIFGVFFAPFPEEDIPDRIAHGPIIRVLTVFEFKVLTKYYLD